MITAYIYSDFSTARRLGENEIPVPDRHNRFYSTGTAWYFRTREGTTEGPFDSRLHAHKANQQYIREHQISKQ